MGTVWSNQSACYLYPWRRRGLYPAECKKRADDVDRAEAWNIFFLNQSRKDYLDSALFAISKEYCMPEGRNVLENI